MSNIIHISNNSWQAEVIESDIPVLVDFWAEWCGPCKMIDSIINELSNDFDGKIKFCKVDVEKNQELVEKFAIKSIPFLLMIKNNIVKNQISGTLSKVALKNRLIEFLL